ncbi:response regulator [uncultured Corynebacterium sp.]|uniref:response regulator n=1 Tax=uncultured Corynebacterium sp. TaxID=159447 RepID=UPI0025F6821D|nr:response regulator transcription factor [uncultured Corynebacterium sp.]
MSSEKILMVEDDAALANAVLVTLRARGYDVKVATTANAAIRLASEWHPQALLLDLGLPDMSGLDVLRALRSWSDVPVLVVSARHDEAGKINALDEGADDYVTKPFSVGELLARLRAALRRAPSEDAPEVPVVKTSDGRVVFDLPEKRVTVSGEEVHLTPREWGIVEHMIRHQGRLVTKVELLQAVWGESYKKETNYLRVYMSQLRSKLEQDPANPQYFTTELGVGYRLVL